MKHSGAKLWLLALALQLPLGVVAADNATPASSSRVTAGEALTLPNALPIDDVAPAVGSLTLQWTLSGRRDPVDCSALGAEHFELTLQAAASSPDDDAFRAPCDAFEISLDLPPGSYTGEAVLADRLERPVTLTVPIEQVDIVAGRSAVKTVDFPVAAFLSGS